MAPSPDDFLRTRSTAGSPQARDRGLRRSRRLTRWIAVTAVAGAAALGSFYTHLLPGSAAPAAPASPPVQNPSASPATTVGGDDGGRSAGNSHEDADEDDADEDDDEGRAPVAQPAPQAPTLQPPAQPPAATQQPQTTTGAS
jgi:hypothetical protein